MEKKRQSLPWLARQENPCDLHANRSTRTSGRCMWRNGFIFTTRLLAFVFDKGHIR